MNEWTLASESMPKEHPTIITKLMANTEAYKGLNPKYMGLPRLRSSVVIATCEFPNGERVTLPAWTADGEWTIDYKLPFDVVAWMPMPEPYKEDE